MTDESKMGLSEDYNKKRGKENEKFLKNDSKNKTNFRLTVRKKTSKNPIAYNIASNLHKSYYSVFGTLHTLPDYLIIGAAKCGTSSLYEYLIQHPNVKPAAGKEINFFDKNYSKGQKWYRTYFPRLVNKNKIKSNIITGEATPRYIDHPQAPIRVKKLIPDVKLIILLRNPIDRAYSHWNMLIRNPAIETKPFEEAVKLEKKRIDGLYKKMENDENFYSPEYYQYAYLDRGLYLTRIKRWIKYFPRQQFLILDSEEFFNEPSRSYEKVLEFLKLPKIKLPKYDIFRKGAYKNSKMKNETRMKLIDFYKPHNNELNEFLGTNFVWDK